ncbi:holin [Ornithinibacillus bavariensis]|uniref:Holin n=1 Tax=Ornithinibacillus bavariensis TaxID=545502 RepID=A0A920C6E7_9BACI|nr:holin [Ornithinibacillus bavariensis]GIO27715.1 holin [Ornithinibacillus bavariensis]
MFEIALIITVVLAFTELIKHLGLSNRYLPVASLVLGLLAGIFYVGGTLKEQIMYGLMIGLSAAGLFDQSKIVTKK